MGKGSRGRVAVLPPAGLVLRPPLLKYSVLHRAAVAQQAPTGVSTTLSGSRCWRPSPPRCWRRRRPRTGTCSPVRACCWLPSWQVQRRESRVGLQGLAASAVSALSAGGGARVGRAGQAGWSDLWNPACPHAPAMSQQHVSHPRPCRCRRMGGRHRRLQPRLRSDQLRRVPALAPAAPLAAAAALLARLPGAVLGGGAGATGGRQRGGGRGPCGARPGRCQRRGDRGLRAWPEGMAWHMQAGGIVSYWRGCLPPASTCCGIGAAWARHALACTYGFASAFTVLSGARFGGRRAIKNDGCAWNCKRGSQNACERMNGRQCKQA